MKKVTITCDICGSEERVMSLRLPMFRTFDATDGKTFYDTPDIVFEDIDICLCCLGKVTNLHDMRVRGFGKILLEQNPELKK